MCLIVVKNSNDAKFSVEDCKGSLQRNSDGTGIMYVENGRVIVEKCLGTQEEQLKMYYKHMNKTSFILHHRFATQGTKEEKNCHPFKVMSKDDGDEYDLYFAHNGHISMSHFNTDHDKTLSDTNLFTVEYMIPMIRKYPDIIDNAAFQSMVHIMLGAGNKLAFLRSDSRILIFNKSQGDEYNGCWVSNKGFVPYKSYADRISETNNFGRNHGHNAYSADDYSDYDDGVYWRKEWNNANEIKIKFANTKSGMTIDEIVTALETYKGMPAASLETLFTEEPHMVYDMIYLLSKKGTIDERLLDKTAWIVGEQLYDLLQAYSKLQTREAA